MFKFTEILFSNECIRPFRTAIAKFLQIFIYKLEPVRHKMSDSRHGKTVITSTHHIEDTSINNPLCYFKNTYSNETVAIDLLAARCLLSSVMNYS